jgi:hypothetical protein
VRLNTVIKKKELIPPAIIDENKRIEASLDGSL